jgi:hypothetical protein
MALGYHWQWDFQPGSGDRSDRAFGSNLGGEKVVVGMRSRYFLLARTDIFKTFDLSLVDCSGKPQRLLDYGKLQGTLGGLESTSQTV